MDLTRHVHLFQAAKRTQTLGSEERQIALRARSADAVDDGVGQ